MLRRLDIAVVAAMLVAGSALVPAWTSTAWADEIDEAAQLWRQMRRADPDTAEYKGAQWRLSAKIGTTGKARHVEMATAMMQRSAPPGVNEAALRMFGADPFDPEDIRKLLYDPQRSFPQRELVKACYAECRPRHNGSLMSETVRRRLVAILADRIAQLAGTRMHYGEQRLFVHLTTSVMGRCPDGSEQAECVRLIAALEKYSEQAPPGDTFGAAIPVWLDLRKRPVPRITTFSQAARLLGHWDPIERLKASAWLGERVGDDDKAAMVVMAMLDDIRDEARAEAARVFSYARDYKPDAVVPKLMILLTQDRSTVVQTAAAEALSARAPQAAAQVDVLLGVLNSPARRLGPNRTSCILTVLSRLATLAAPSQRGPMLEIAVRRLRTSPEGALALLKALGPDAASALPAIRDYREAADRDQRTYIDLHVLPAIEPDMTSAN